MNGIPSIDERVLRLPDVKDRTGLSRSTIYDWIKQGKFPQPIRIGDRSVGWLQSDITNWISAKAMSRNSHDKK